MTQRSFTYLVSGDSDRLWGITVDNVGEYCVPPGYDCYPPLVGHPEGYFFDVDKGRVMDNYQLVYITQGRGWYYESPDKRVALNSGSMLIIPPYTWHSYCPDKKTGWQEYWIGIRGPHIDSRYENGFFCRRKIIHEIGLHEQVIGYYKEAIEIALSEKSGYQQVLAAIANSILAYTLYYDHRVTQSRSVTDDKMDRARSMMREKFLSDITPVQVAEAINMSYSWFRKTFKKYTNMSPAHYITFLKLQKAKSLLFNSSMSVKEIAFSLNYEDAAYFSSIFKKYIGLSPSEYRANCTGCITKGDEG